MRKKKYFVNISVKVGDYLNSGDIYADCQETPVIKHYCMLSPLLNGEVVWAAENAEYTINDVVCKIKNQDNIIELTLCQNGLLDKIGLLKKEKVSLNPW